MNFINGLVDELIKIAAIRPIGGAVGMPAPVDKTKAPASPSPTPIKSMTAGQPLKSSAAASVPQFGAKAQSGWSRQGTKQKLESNLGPGLKPPDMSSIRSSAGMPSGNKNPLTTAMKGGYGVPKATQDFMAASNADAAKNEAKKVSVKSNVKSKPAASAASADAAATPAAGTPLGAVGAPAGRQGQSVSSYISRAHNIAKGKQPIGSVEPRAGGIRTPKEDKRKVVEKSKDLGKGVGKSALSAAKEQAPNVKKSRRDGVAETLFGKSKKRNSTRVRDY